jgi:phospholipid transport system substrate-binding protein
LLCLLALAPTAGASLTDPAVAQVQSLTDSLLKSMQAGPNTSVIERYKSLKPVIDEVFAMTFMTRLCVGPDWAGFPPEQQKAIITAFGRFTIANYAYNFNQFDGQKFEIDETVLTRGEDKVVRTRLISPHDSATNLLYRMREVDGAWRIVDVYYNGVSELALRRSDFAAALASGGAPALIAHLNKASEDLMK